MSSGISPGDPLIRVKVESNVRRAMEQAWKHNHSYMETLAGHPLDSCPTAAEFVYLCARRVAWQCAEENSMT